MNTNEASIKTYKYFSTLEGNQHIASVFALKKIVDIIEIYKVKNVLELGLGIGSISFCVLDFIKENSKTINYSGTESNDFCIKALPKYLKSHYSKLHIYNNLNEVITNTKFDLIIIDGKEENLLKIKELISERGIIIIEGDRVPQLELIQSVFSKHKYVRVVSNQLNLSYGPCSDYATHYIGGIQLIFIKPNFYQKMHFLYYKIVTAIRYKIRD